MSWSLFKRNILRKTNPVNNPTLNVNEVATIWAEEYEAAVKRGRDFINLEVIQTGNFEIMRNLFRAALLKGLTTPPGTPFSLVNEFGNGVKAYWAGAQMRPFPIPLIPAPGSIQNLQVNSNVVTNVGVWPIYPPIKPASKQIIMVNMFVLAAIVHLFSIGGIIQTTSLYPSAPSPVPAPGVIPWTGYLIPPAIPIPNINFPSEDGSEPPVLETSDEDIVSELNQQINTPTEYEVSDLLNGDTSLLNVINVSLPDDTSEAFNVDQYIKDFRKQLIAQQVHCD
jgi:hypothetical protein